MKKYLLLSLLGLTSVSAMAQKKNRIEIGMLQYQFLGVESQTSFCSSSFLELTTPSISYERTISPRFGIFAQYIGIPENSNIGYENRQEISEASVGKVQDRNSLNYADLGGRYSLIQGKRHQLSARLGLSYAWGTYVYVF
jgi:hypothetical protein